MFLLIRLKTESCFLFLRAALHRSFENASSFRVIDVARVLEFDHAFHGKVLRLYEVFGDVQDLLLAKAVALGLLKLLDGLNVGNGPALLRLVSD